MLRRHWCERFGLGPTCRVFGGAPMQAVRYSALGFPVGTPTRDPDYDNIYGRVSDSAAPIAVGN